MRFNESSLNIRPAALCLALLAACGPSLPGTPDPAALVDPRIGTGGFAFTHGAAFVGASVPNGLAKPGPDTRGGTWGEVVFLHYSGYWAHDDEILGFSQLHLHGTGAPDLGVLSVMPGLAYKPDGRSVRDYAQHFEKEKELARAGHYTVTLGESGIVAEMTATTHVAHHRWTFPAGSPGAVVLVDLAKTLDSGRIEDASFTLDAGNKAIRGQFHSAGGMSGGSGGLTVFFEGRFNRAWTARHLFVDGAAPADVDTASGDAISGAFEFDPTAGPVELQLALSTVDATGAANNLAIETPSIDFDGTVTKAHDAWNGRLSKIELFGADAVQARIFYSAFAKAFVMPSTYSDADGRFRQPGDTLSSSTEFKFVGDLSLWDTYRTANPLYSLVAPDAARDVARSLLEFAPVQGFPRWTIGHRETGVMVGAPADIVIADAIVKGVPGIDANDAWAKLRAVALGLENPPGGRGTRGDLTQYNGNGGWMTSSSGRSVSRTVEYNHADFALAALATHLGHADDALALTTRSQGWRKLWDDGTKLLRAHDPDGTMTSRPDFDPKAWRGKMPDGSDYEDYVEATALQTVWGTPYDVPGNVELHGGNDAFIAALETFMNEGKSDLERIRELAPNTINDRSADRPWYWPSNEPSMHIPWMFAQAGDRARTETWVRWVAANYFDETPDGLAGNDDGGTLSSWYVFATLGLYPLAGTDTYIVASPLVPRATVAIGDGVFTLDTENFGPARGAVKEVTLDGAPVGNTLTHDRLKAGGRLLFKFAK